MKKIAALLLLGTFLFTNCKTDKKKVPNVSHIEVNTSLKRFDKDLFGIDTTNVLSELNKLYEKYPSLTPIFIEHILGLDPSILSQGVSDFIRISQPIATEAATIYAKTDELEKEFNKAFRFVKYYFPDYAIPELIALVGPVDLLAESATGLSPNFLGPDFLGISLQFYLGSENELYQQPFFIENVAPLYRSRRFSKEYMVADAMQLIADDIFPDKSLGKPLIEQMIERGKQWWLLDKFLPEVADSVKTGYTQKQLDWCRQYEGDIWATIVKNEDLYSVAPATLQTYIGESPFTQGLSQEYSPGNIGQWIGWQILKKYESENSSLKIEQIMNASAKTIIDGAAYKPK